FREFRPFLDSCRYVGCSHTKERGCGVLEALERGEISKSRHDSYLRLYEQAKQIKEWDLPK
ncbi:MAG: ribosome small subunit-dependent GTPase A, partial [Oscillospiraceae bacterium]